MNPLKLTILEAVLWVMSQLTHPRHLRCPKGTSLMMGVRRSGEAICYPLPLGGDDDVLTGHQTSIQPPGELRMQVYCTATEDAVQDGIQAWCRRRVAR